MSQRSFPTEWTNQFTDPYAVLGISVTADDRRVLKRYREVAKVLHPDRYAQDMSTDREFATQLFARLVNPSYEQVKQERGRKEVSANLRLKVRRLCREAPLSPKSDIARQLMEHPASGVEVFYEQAIAKLADAQYQEFDDFPALTEQISELNLVYFQLKMGETLVREKRTGLVAADAAKPLQFTPAAAPEVVTTESYDQRHYRRAQEYAKKGAWSQVTQELRDAIKIKADKSDYHALLGIAYLQQNLQGMAKVHLRRALELDSQNSLANKYATKVGLQSSTPSPSNGRKPTSSPAAKSRQKPGKSIPQSKSKPSTINPQDSIAPTAQSPVSLESNQGIRVIFRPFLKLIRSFFRLFRPKKYSRPPYK